MLLPVGEDANIASYCSWCEHAVTVLRETSKKTAMKSMGYNSYNSRSFLKKSKVCHMSSFPLFKSVYIFQEVWECLTISHRNTCKQSLAEFVWSDTNSSDIYKTLGCCWSCGHRYTKPIKSPDQRGIKGKPQTWEEDASRQHIPESTHKSCTHTHTHTHTHMHTNV